MTAVCALWDRLACGRVAVSAVGLGGMERLGLGRWGGLAISWARPTPKAQGEGQ